MTTQRWIVTPDDQPPRAHDGRTFTSEAEARAYAERLTATTGRRHVARPLGRVVSHRDRLRNAATGTTHDTPEARQ